jgi:hypothetical protein
MAIVYDVKITPVGYRTFGLDLSQYNLDGPQLREYRSEWDICAKEVADLSFDLFITPERLINDAESMKENIDRILSSPETLVIQRSITDYSEKVVFTQTGSYSIVFCNLDEYLERNLKLTVDLSKKRGGRRII